MTSTLPGLRYRSSGMLVLLFWMNLAGLVSSYGQENSATEEHLAEMFSQAQAAQQKIDYRTAAKCYEEIVKLRPDVAEAWANLGLMYQFLEEYPKADHNFQVALGKNPRLYVPNLFLGLNRLRARQPAIALRYLRVAESLNPKDEQAAMGLARAYQTSDNDTAASKWFSRATEINPGDPDAWYGLGVAYLSLQDAAVVQLVKLGQNGPYARALVADAFVVQGRVRDAINIYNKLLASPVQPPCLLVSLGFAYAQQGSDLARKTFEDELRKNPGCLTVRLGLARLALAKGDLPGALNEVYEAWNADHDFVRANLQRVWQGADSDQLAAAWQKASSQDNVARTWADGSKEQTKTEVDSEDPERMWTRGHYTACEATLHREKIPVSSARALLLAQCSFYAGDYRTSLTASAAALNINRRSSPALYWKAKSAQELAADALERMNAAAPGSAKVHLLLAELHRAREEFGAAEAEYTEVISSSSNDPAAHLGLAQVYYQESQDDKVLQQLQFVLQADPTSPAGSFLMGQVLVRRHQYAEATPYLKIALDGPLLSLPQVHSLLSRCLAAKGDYSGALAELKTAVPSDTTGIYHYQLYRIYQKLGDAKDAAAAFQESEKLRRAASEAGEKNKAVPGAEVN
jgi:tetratricopeptide (TPR) repeat protein